VENVQVVAVFAQQKSRVEMTSHLCILPEQHPLGHIAQEQRGRGFAVLPVGSPPGADDVKKILFHYLGW